MTDPRPDAESRAHRFEECFVPVAPALRAWAELRLAPALRRRVDPEDVVQEVGSRALEAFDEFDPERGSFRGWLFGIANHVVLGVARQLARQPRGAAESTSGWSLDQVPLAVTTIVSRLAKDEAMRAFTARAETLSKEDRRLLLLRGIEGLPHAEVAELLGASPDAVAQRWTRLRRRVEAWPDVQRIWLG